MKTRNFSHKPSQIIAKLMVTHPWRWRAFAKVTVEIAVVKEIMLVAYSGLILLILVTQNHTISMARTCIVVMSALTMVKMTERKMKLSQATSFNGCM